MTTRSFRFFAGLTTAIGLVVAGVVVWKTSHHEKAVAVQPLTGNSRMGNVAQVAKHFAGEGKRRETTQAKGKAQEEKIESRLAAVRAARDANALYELALELSHEKTIPNYKKRAMGAMEEAARLGSVKAMLAAGDFARDGFGQSANGKKAIEWYQKAADAGNSTGDVAIARILLGGELLPPDFDLATVHLDRAIAANNAEAYYVKGAMLVDQAATAAEGTKLLLQASSMGYTSADLLLAKLGVQSGVEDESALKSAISSAAARGNTRAMVLQASAVLADSTASDEASAAAVRALIDASEKGDTLAMIQLAMLSRAGKSPTPQDIVLARQYGLDAYNHGDAAGSFVVASTYAIGNLDADTAMSWLLKGKTAGDWRSSYAVALIRTANQSVEQAMETASKATFADYTDYSLAKSVGVNGVTPPTVLSANRPSMPAGLAGVAVEAQVTADIRIDEHGKVTGVNIVSSTHPQLNDAVIQTLSNWKFNPALRDGRAIPFTIRQPIRFKST